MFYNRKRCSKTKKGVLKQENDNSKQEIWSFFLIFFFYSFRPGTSRDRGICHGIFAPALVQGQRDTGTRIFFVAGQRDNGTSRPDLSRDVPSRGNTSFHLQNVFAYVCISEGFLHYLSHIPHHSR
jgi:hypothetical protein